MSVIIRLQNLPWSANAADIRAYFGGLSIPEGGVHIVGGEQGDAFIAFSTDEDARQAMLRDGGKLKEVMIKLFLSSRTEMLKVIEQARQQTLNLQHLMQASVPAPQPSPPTDLQGETGVTVVSQSAEDGDSKSKEDNGNDKERRDRRRSRSRGRDRDRERSRDRSRDRSRERSRRDRERDRRRRDRSRSRDRYRSRRSKSRDRNRRDRSWDRNDYRRSRDSEYDARKETDDQWEGHSNDHNAQLKKPSAPEIVQPKIENNTTAPPEQQYGLPDMTKTKVENMTMEMPIPTDQQPPINYMGEFPLMAGFPGPLGPGGMPLGSMPPGTQPPNGMPPGGMPMCNPMVPGMMGPGMTPAGMFPGMPLRGVPREGWPSAPMGGMAFPRPPMGPGDMMPMGTFPPSGMGMSAPLNPPPMNSNWNFPPPKVEQPPESNTCVEIHGLPLNVTYSDVKKLFDGLPISQDGIKMINDTQGNRTGIAYVKFMQHSYKLNALNCNGKKVKGNIVEVMHLKETIFNSAVDNFLNDKEIEQKIDVSEIKNGSENENWVINNERPPFKFQDPRLLNKINSNSSPASGEILTKRQGNDCILIKGLPVNCSERDLYDFFSEIGVSPIHVHVVLDNVGHPVGDAFCQFETPTEAEKAGTKNNTNMGRHTVTIKTIGREELEKIKGVVERKEKALDRNERNMGGDRSLDPRTERLGMRGEMRMERGDPRAERGEPRMERADPRVERGDPRVDRSDPRVERPEQRMERGDPRLDRGDPRMDRGDTRIERIDPRMERVGDLRMERVGGQRVDRGDPRMDRIDPRADRGDPRAERGDSRMDRIDPRMERGDPRMDRNLRMDRMDNRVDRLEPRMERIDPRMERVDLRMEDPGYVNHRGANFRHRGRVDVDEYEERYHREPYREYVVNNRGRGGLLRGRNEGGRGGRGSRGRNEMRGGRGGTRPQSPYIENEALEKFGRPGCVVGLENLHFRASIEEILAFFEGFEVDHEDVIRRFDDAGRPTGDARVALKTPEEAQRAIEQLAFQTMRGRTIKLSIVPSNAS